MTLTNAQRQKRYRRRHLGHELMLVSLDVRVAVHDRLDGLAWHYDCSLARWSRSWQRLPNGMLRRG
jgi:hypothetical protein